MTRDPLQFPLTHRITADRQPPSIGDYEASGGYAAVRQTLGKTDPRDVTQQVKDAKLRGRGGAGFPAGMKWSFVPMDDPQQQKYVVVNGDEMEPGTFKDRLLIEGDPHLLIEGILLTAYAIQATEAFIFLRLAYHVGFARLETAIAEARDAGLLGKNILGSGFDLTIHVHSSAGRYICGEETALLNALEGKRATPREKPPFPAVVGAWGQPTVVNNIETLCCVPGIVAHGADWFRGLGLTDDAGTKLFGASGRVKRPGVWELPMGTPVRELLDEHAGGMRDGYALKAWLPGGASTDFLTAEHLDLPMDYDAIGQAGSRMGTGLITVIDDQQSMVSVLRNLEHFFAQESCGWCTPCRDGIPWVEKILLALEAGQGRPGDLEILEQHTRLLGPGRTFCAHAPGAMEPLQSALKYFRAEFEAGIAPPKTLADLPKAS